MNELDYLLGAFVDVDYGFRCLLEVMEALEEQAETKETRDMENLLYISNKIIGNLQEELQENIEKLDKYIMQHR